MAEEGVLKLVSPIPNDDRLRVISFRCERTLETDLEQRRKKVKKSKVPRMGIRIEGACLPSSGSSSLSRFAFFDGGDKAFLLGPASSSSACAWSPSSSDSTMASHEPSLACRSNDRSLI